MWMHGVLVRTIKILEMSEKETAHRDGARIIEKVKEIDVDEVVGSALSAAPLTLWCAGRSVGCLLKV